MSGARDATPWYVAAFRRGYLDVYEHRSDDAAEEEVTFVAAALQLSPGMTVLDAGCGAGRHARALAARGARVTGIDLSRELLAAARSRNAAARPAPDYVRGDLRHLPFRAAVFGGVGSLFTTFGYFGDAENLGQLVELRRVLRPAGRLVLDFLNAARVRATLVRHSEREVAGRPLVEQRAIREGRVEKIVTFTDEGGELRRWRESVRLYDRADLERMLGQAGLDVCAAHGDLAGGSWSEGAARTILVAVKR